MKDKMLHSPSLVCATIIVGSVFLSSFQPAAAETSNDTYSAEQEDCPAGNQCCVVGDIWICD